MSQHRPDALTQPVGPHDDHVEQAVVGPDAGAEPHPGRDDLAAVGDEHHGGVGVVLGTVNRDDVVRVLRISLISRKVVAT